MPKKRPSRRPSESAAFIAEIVGHESMLGRRMPAGKLLHMMDLAAASAAWRHCRSRVVTLAFDRIELLKMICHRDLVRYDAKVIEVGRSSIVVKLDGFAKPPTENEEHRTNSGVITMVAIDEDKRPDRTIPGLRYQGKADEEIRRYAEVRREAVDERKRLFVDIDQRTKIALKDLVDPHPRKNTLSPSESSLVTRTMYLPRNANALGVVFGGDIIEQMEEVAVAAARQFTGNVNVVTVAMEDVLFLHSITLASLVEMEAAVTYVKHHSLDVKVTVRFSHGVKQNEKQTSNSGTFSLLSFDRAGRKMAIPNGLDMKKANLEERKEYLKGQVKYDFRLAKKSR